MSDYSPWNYPGQNTGVGSCNPSLEDLPNPGIEPRSPPLQVDSLPAEPPEKYILRNFFMLANKDLIYYFFIVHCNTCIL